MNENASKAQLLEILKGTSQTKFLDAMIINGKKLSNPILRGLVEILIEQKYPLDSIINIILALDESVEKGYLDDETIDQVINDPSKLILNKEN